MDDDDDNDDDDDGDVVVVVVDSDGTRLLDRCVRKRKRVHNIYYYSRCSSFHSRIYGILQSYSYNIFVLIQVMCVCVCTTSVAFSAVCDFTYSRLYYQVYRRRIYKCGIITRIILL